MQGKRLLSHFCLILCLTFSFLPLNSFIVSAESLVADSLSEGARNMPATSLSGEDAIAHLKQNQEYESLQEAVRKAQQHTQRVDSVDALASFQQDAYLKASNTDRTDEFGRSVAISGDTVVVGALIEASSAAGVNGNQADNSMLGAGAVYVFVRSGNSWSQQAYLKASNPDIEDGFGYVVAIDGDTLVVGAPFEESNATGVNGNQSDNSANLSGAVYVFVRNGTTWSQQAYLKASNTDTSDRFGTSIAISGDTIIIGAPYEKSNATGINGNQSDNSAFNAGAAYIFVRNGTTWSQQAYVKASNNEAGDLFGDAVAIEGDTAVVGANGEDSAATGINGNQNDNSLEDTGAVYVFARNGTGWTQTDYVKLPASPLCATLNFVDCPRFGTVIDLSGDTLGVLSTQSEAVYIFVRSTTGWNFQYSYDTTLYARGGYPSFSISGDRFMLSLSVGSRAYVFKRSGTTWSEESQLIGGNRSAFAVAIEGNTLLIGDPSDRSNATGVNGDPNNTDAPGSGAAYIYSIVPPPTCGGLVQEAENVNALLSGFTIANDPTASGGSYIGAASGGNYYNGSNPSFKAEYCFNVPTAGTYRIKAKTYAADNLSDSFYVQVDGAPTSGYLWDVAQNTSYATDYVNDRNNADPVELNLTAGQHIVTVYLREQGTRLDTIALEQVVTPPEPTCAGLVQEAESGVITGNWGIGSDAVASGGSYIHAPEGSGNFWNGANATQKASYCFNVTTAGTYRVKGNVYGADTLSDSFYVQVDGAPSSGYLWDILPNTTYASDFVNDRGVVDPVEVQLTAGQHTVNVFVREDGSRLDTIELQLVDSGPPPTPVCAGLFQEAETGALRGNFTLGSDTAASGGQYVGTPAGSGDFWNGANANHSVSYCFNVPTAGTYRIDGKVYGADTLSDSFYVQVDGSPSSGYLWDVLRNTSYAVDSVNNRNVADPVLVTLSSGQHTVTVFARESGTRLDTIQLVATTPAPQSRAIPILAQGIHGTIHLNASNLNAEVDFSTIQLSLIDAETNGQAFRQTVTADRFGSYHFDGMMPGKYVVQVEVPSGLVASTSSATVNATQDEPVTVDFAVSTGNKTYLPLIGR